MLHTNAKSRKIVLKVYMENLKTVIEYRFIPRSIYEEHIQPINIQQSFKDMFEKEDVYLSRV